jgi:hypothetical protein
VRGRCVVGVWQVQKSCVAGADNVRGNIVAGAWQARGRRVVGAVEAGAKKMQRSSGGALEAVVRYSDSGHIFEQLNSGLRGRGSVSPRVHGGVVTGPRGRGGKEAWGRCGVAALRRGYNIHEDQCRRSSSWPKP